MIVRFLRTAPLLSPPSQPISSFTVLGTWNQCKYPLWVNLREHTEKDSRASKANDRPLFTNSPLSPPFSLLLENATYANIIFLFQSIWRNTLRKNAIQEHLELMIVHKDPSSPRPHLFFPWSVLFLISHFCIISTTFWQFFLNLDISY